MKYRLLDKVDSPQDIKGLSTEELNVLCAEIRDYMVDCCSRNPGHLASSLGAVELIVGLHSVFNAPEDKIVFDVGHQAYAHKIITGRREAFKLNRTKDGISGFPKMEESPYDAFGVGHSSTSISAALGYAEAAKLQGLRRKNIAVIGDGALTGGLALEGLNNAGVSDADVLVILNDNNHSIDDNTGALHNHLLRITTSRAYNRAKERIWEHMAGRKSRAAIQRGVKSLKSWAVKGTGGDLFEALGFRYFGPIDGNDIRQVTETLRKIKDIKGPRVLHCLTEKGHGYAPAVADPTVWHAPGKFDPQTGERVLTDKSIDRYQDVFGQVLVELASRDRRVVGVTPAMASGCGMSLLSEKLPTRFFDVGIEEEHAVTFSAGLAAGGMRPFCNIYSSFSQRAYDCIIHDVALQGLPVVLCFDRAGLVGEDGPTHHGAYDMAAYRSIPGLTICAPSDETELKTMMYTALESDTPTIIRYPRGKGEGADWKSAPYTRLAAGKARQLREGSRLAVLALGPAAHNAARAADAFSAEHGHGPAVFDMRYLKPFDMELMKRIVTEYDTVLTLEDGCLKGGLFSEVAEYTAGQAPGLRVECAGIPDTFITQDRQSEERAECGLDTGSILKKIENLYEIC